MILRTDPSRHRLVYLSIPRDLRVLIPGHGEDGSTRRSSGRRGADDPTIQNLTARDQPRMIVDFRSFKSLIDNIGGSTNVPAPILPTVRLPLARHAVRAAAMVQQGDAAHERTARTHLLRTVRTSSIRQTATSPGICGSRRDTCRHGRCSASTVLKLPFNGDSLLNPLTTDLSDGSSRSSAGCWKRAGQKNALHCRLGVKRRRQDRRRVQVIVGNEDNLSVVQMVTGRAAAQPPRPGSGQYGPGCVVGNRQFR
jgi:hypothetical protein